MTIHSTPPASSPAVSEPETGGRVTTMMEPYIEIKAANTGRQLL
jgi:hypothetical protein